MTRTLLLILTVQARILGALRSGSMETVQRMAGDCLKQVEVERARLAALNSQGD